MDPADGEILWRSRLPAHHDVDPVCITELIREGEYPECYPRDPQFSPDGDTIASTCWYSGEVVVYDAATLTLKSQISTGDPQIRGIRFVGDTEVLVVGLAGPGIILETDTDKLIELAQDRVVGEFTWEECEAFGIDPCPAEPEPEEDEFEDSEDEPDDEEEPEA